MNSSDFVEIKAPEITGVTGVPQERISGDILHGRGPRRGNLEQLLRYWRPIMRKPGGFRRCLVILADHPELYPLPNMCAWLHHETTGKWPNEGNHHGRAGRAAKKIIRRSLTPKKRKSYAPEMVGGFLPYRGLLRRHSRETKGLSVQPIGGRYWLLDEKVDRHVEEIASFLLPGEAHPFRMSPTRNIAMSAFFPGGIGPGGIGGPDVIRGIGPRTRGGRARRALIRCPAGFEKGGHFSNRFLSTCGRQLFILPGSARARMGRNVAGRAGEAIQRVTGKALGAPLGGAPQQEAPQARPVEMVGQPPPDVGRPNPTRVEAVVDDVVKKMQGMRRSGGSDVVHRLVRGDGTVVTPVVQISELSGIRNNRDMKDSVLVSSYGQADARTGVDEVASLGNGILRLVLVVGGKRVDVVPPKAIGPAKQRQLREAVAAITSTDIGNGAFAGLRRLSQNTGLFELRGLGTAPEPASEAKALEKFAHIDHKTKLYVPRRPAIGSFARNSQIWAAPLSGPDRSNFFFKA